MNVVWKISLALLLFGPVGCASTRQVVPLPDQGKNAQDSALARIYLIRPTMAGGAHSMKITDNGKLVGHTGPDGFLCWERRPGAVSIVGEANNIYRIDLTVAAGSVTYIRQSMHEASGMFTVDNSLTLLGKTEGEELLAACDPPDLEAP